MVYKTFQTKIAGTLQSHLGPGYRLLFQKVPKTMAFFLTAFPSSGKGEKASPTIYLNSYYERYLEGIPFNSIIKEILQIYQDNSSVTDLDFSILNDFSQLKEKVLYKLIHTASNKEMLADMPWIPFLDLSIVFYLFLEQTESGQMTALVHNDHMKAWGTDEKELKNLALANTPSMLPPRLTSMSDVMKSIAREHLDGDYQEEFIDSLFSSQAFSPLHVLTNSSGINGASAVLYPELLKNFADRMESDLIILPSSIHEVLLIPNTENASFEDLANMVSHINRAEVPVEDRLSDQVYLYSRERDIVTIAGPAVSSVLS